MIYGIVSLVIYGIYDFGELTSDSTINKGLWSFKRLEWYPFPSMIKSPGANKDPGGDIWCLVLSVLSVRPYTRIGGTMYQSLLRCVPNIDTGRYVDNVIHIYIYDTYGNITDYKTMWRISIHMYVCTYIYMYVCMHACMHACMYVCNVM